MSDVSTAPNAEFALSRVPRTPFFVVTKNQAPVTEPLDYAAARAVVVKLHKQQGTAPPRMARAPPIRIFSLKGAGALDPKVVEAARVAMTRNGKPVKRASAASALVRAGVPAGTAHAAVAAAWRAARKEKVAARTPAAAAAEDIATPATPAAPLKLKKPVPPRRTPASLPPPTQADAESETESEFCESE